MTGRESRPAAGPVRELRLLGRTRDGAALVLEADGDTFVLRADEAMLAALGTTAGRDTTPVALTPREIQSRVRRGETAAAIAVDADLDLAAVERFAGPVMAERQHQARLAAASPVRERTLGELVAAHTLAREPAGTGADAGPAEPDWDAWLEPTRPGVATDALWRVRVAWPSGAHASFAWRPATRVVRPLDPTARAVIDDEPVDLLEAVLRPLRPAGPTERAIPTGAEAITGTGTTGAETTGAETTTSTPRAEPSGRGRRAVVPSWEEITSTKGGPESQRPS